jgi:stalled ribosome alternative rescue factor ArfA
MLHNDKRDKKPMTKVLKIKAVGAVKGKGSYRREKSNKKLQWSCAE